MASGDNWSTEELKASVETYADMYIAEVEGRRINKSKMYRDLEAKFGRANKAFERRMQNISFVVTTLGGNWVKGLKPLSNVGANTEIILRKLIDENGFLESRKPLQPESTEPLPVEESDQKAIQLLRDWGSEDIEILPPKGFNQVDEYKTETTQRKRCPEVKAWVLRNAEGSCESCGSRAPFYKENGIPYLEVHHVVHLADGGPDTTHNAVAVCPNCHRALHLALDRNSMADRLYEEIERLRKP